jgi:hypothetical protein
MSLTLVKPYFAARAKAVGMKEHIDYVNEDNIPQNLVDGSFHVLLDQFNGIKLNQTDQEINCGVVLTFWLKGYRNPYDGLDRAVAKSELLLKEVLKNSNRLGQCLKNVVFNNVKYSTIASDNDNTIKCTMHFTAFTSLLIS